MIVALEGSDRKEAAKRHILSSILPSGSKVFSWSPAIGPPLNDGPPKGNGSFKFGAWLIGCSPEKVVLI